MAASMRSQGWYIKEEKYEECKQLTQSGSTQEVTGVLLNTDLKQIGAAALPDEFTKNKISKFEGPLVLQIQKLRNITAPSIRQESSTAARMYRFSLSDGCQTVAAIEMEPLHSVGPTTAPGMKLLLKGSLQVNQSIILLNNGNCKLLGGRVDNMYEKWQLDKELKTLSRNTNRMDGPPPFVPFGTKVNKEQVQHLSGKFKSLDIANAKEANEAAERDNSEFDAQRQAVITQALQKGSGAKKTYGGIKQMTADEPLQMAEFRRTEKKPKKTTVDDKDPNVSDEEEGYGRGRGRRGRRGQRGDDEDSEMLVPSTRPSNANTLFDFLGGKLAKDEKKEPDHSGGQSSHRPHTAQSDYNSAQSQYSGDRRPHTSQGYNQSHHQPQPYNSHRSDHQQGRGYQQGRDHQNGRDHPQERDHQQSYNTDRRNYQQGHNQQGRDRPQGRDYPQGRNYPQGHNQQQSYNSHQNHPQRHDRYQQGRDHQQSYNTDRRDHQQGRDQYQRPEQYQRQDQHQGRDQQQGGNQQSSQNTKRHNLKKGWDPTQAYEEPEESYQPQGANRLQERNQQYQHKPRNEDRGAYDNGDDCQYNSHPRNQGANNQQYQNKSASTQQGNQGYRGQGQNQQESRQPQPEKSKQGQSGKPVRNETKPSQADRRRDSRPADSRQNQTQAASKQKRDPPAKSQEQGSQSTNKKDKAEKSGYDKKPVDRFAGKMYSDDTRQTAKPEPAKQETKQPKREKASAASDKKAGSTSQTSGSLSVGDMVLAKYWEDGQWYKFRVNKMKSASVVVGLFIEYGNIEEVKISETKPLPSSAAGQKHQPAQTTTQNKLQNRGENHQGQQQPSRGDNYSSQRRGDNYSSQSWGDNYSSQSRGDNYNSQSRGGNYNNHGQGGVEAYQQQQQQRRGQQEFTEYQGDLRQGVSFGRSKPR